MKQPVCVVGVGGEGPGSLTNLARKKIAQASELWGSQRLLADWSEHPGKKVSLQQNLRKTLETLKHRTARERIVILASGDPLFYSIGTVLLEVLPREEVVFFPQISSLQWAFARAGIGWSDAIFTSAHGMPISEVVGWARRRHKLGILTDNENTPGAIAAALLSAGIPDCRAIVAENLGLPGERLTDTRLACLPEMTFDRLNVLLLHQDAHWRPAPCLSVRPDQAYQHRNGLITKADIRALSIVRLQLDETTVVWDIGAGSGAVSIEMAEVAWRGQVYAIERDAENCGFIRQNVSRFGIPNLNLMEGTAPEALEGLPAPTAVFIGGCGGQMRDILNCVHQVALPGCQVVANLATLENLMEALQYMHELGWQPEMSQILLSYGMPIGKNTRLAPLNPVFIVHGTVKGAKRSNDG